MIEQPYAAEILGAMITPAVLISASGTLSLATSNRLGRVVDRVRVLGALAEGMADGAVLTAEEADKRELIAHQLEMLAARIRLLQNSLIMLYAAIGLFVAASLGVGLTNVFGWLPGWASVACGLCGAAALFAASLLLVREARLAVSATLHEMGYVRRVVARKTGRAGA